MPRKVIEKLLRTLRSDILANYAVGTRYRSLEGIGETFGVSRKTAHKAIGCLTREGLVTARPRAGIMVVSHEARLAVKGKRITVLSDLHHRQAEEAIMKGVDDIAGPVGIEVTFLQNPVRNTRSLDFGDYLLGLGTDGVIAVSFGDAALGFYRAMREGLDIVADYDMPELPVLPVVQADFFKYGELAGRYMMEQNRKDILVAGYPSLDSSNCYRERYEGIRSALTNKSIRLRYVCLTQSEAIPEINSFFYSYTNESALFSIEFQANEILASQFIYNRIPPPAVNYSVFVSCERELSIPGLPLIRSFSPSFREYGAALVTRLLRKWQTGTFGQTSVELI